jgi:DNA-binding transcriptional ArsR family regulator
VLFRSIYGFEYEPAVHQNVRNTLYHRIRSRLGELGELERVDDAVRVTLFEPLIIPDPRCSPPPEVDLLRVLARWGHASAREAAEHLGIPLRTAQKALRRLADDGACRREQKGRHIVYHLEDTTFAEPTRH